MLPSLTSFFVLGLALGSQFTYFPCSIALLLIIASGLLTALERRAVLTGRQSLGLLTSLLAGTIYWVLFAWLTADPPIPERDRHLPIQCEGTIVESVRHAPGRLTATVLVTATDDAELPIPFHLRLTWRDPDRGLHRGMKIRLRTHVHAPLGTMNPRGFDYAAYLDAHGVDAVSSVSGPGAVAITPDRSDTLTDRLTAQVESWRDLVRSAADPLPQPSRGLFLSLTVGEQGFLDPVVRDWFMAGGTVHILSISGSHLGLIALLSFASIRFLCIRLPSGWLLRLSRWLTATRLAALFTVLPVAAYTLLAGAETATIRSAIMIAIGLWTVWLGGAPYVLHALAAAAAATLLASPPALYDISFQLSYVSVMALAIVFGRRSDQEIRSDVGPTFRERGLRWLRGSLSVTALVTLATLPLVAFYFNQVPWLGLVANLVVVPFVGFLLLPLSLLSALWVIIVQSGDLPFAGLLDLASRALIAIAQWMAGLPGAEWYVAAPTVPMMLLFYGLGWALLMQVPTGFNSWQRGAMVIGLTLIVGWWLWSPRPISREGEWRVTFLDVGQGDSAVLELPTGEVVLIDGGAAYERFDMGRGIVGPFLWNRGIRHITHVVGTHPQLDHVGGLAWVLSHFPVEQFWTNGATRTEDFWKRIEEVVAQRSVPLQVASAGQVLSADASCRLSVHNPPMPSAGGNGGRSESLNNRSVVMGLACEGRQVLFTADIEREALSRLGEVAAAVPVAVVKVPHHGATSSFDPLWIASLRPDVAVVSAGRRNPYGHPVRGVLEAYQAAGAQVLRTDRDGAVWVTWDSARRQISVHTAREWRLQPAAGRSDVWRVEQENIHRLWQRWNWV